VDSAQKFSQGQYSYAKTVNKGHGRLETRECWAIDDEEYLSYLRKHGQWLGLESIVRILTRRENGEKVKTQVSYYISSLAANAKIALKAASVKIMDLKIWQL
jgi:hypothetical protein